MPWQPAAGPTGRRPAARHPVAIYRRLSAPPLDEAVPWADVHVWWGDDRFVPRDHPASNVKAFDDVMLGIGAREEGTAGVDRPGVPLRVDHVHPFPTGEAIGEGRGAAWCAAELAGELRAAGLDDRDGWPVFDLVFLGIGPDGHLLSVFPGSPALDSPDLALADPGADPHRAAHRAGHPEPGDPRRGAGRAGRGLRGGQGRRARARPRRRARPAPLARPARQAPGGDLDPRRGCRILAPSLTRPRSDGRAGPGHRVDATARRSRVFTSGHGPAAHPRPRHDRRPHDVPRRRPDAGHVADRLRDGSARPGRLGRHAPVRHRARVRGRRRGRRCAGRRRGGARSTSSATRTAGARRSGPRC